MAQFTNRLMADADTTCTAAAIALPNAANTVNSNAIDLGTATPWPVTEGIHVKIVTTAGTAANNKNINFWLEDSADNSTFAAVETGGFLGLINEGSNVYAATEWVAQLPPSVKRYVRVSCLGEANGGDASDGTVQIKLLF